MSDCSSIGLEYESDKKEEEDYVYFKNIKMFIPKNSLKFSSISCYVPEDIED
jgi:hypothetical protein